jgi:hypothetical protein
VVTTDVERLNQVATLSVQLLVAILRIELSVLNDEGLSIANLIETIIVNVLGAIIYTRSSLALVAVSEDGLELAES